MNQRISQLRGQRSGCCVAGARCVSGRMTATGYGASPVPNNARMAAKENRRIEFSTGHPGRFG
jgi:outer membrane protein OmpA-like peptidoglycan-associated protein